MIAAVVLTFDPPDGTLEACIDALVAAGAPPRRIVVDNGGSAATRLADRVQAGECEVIATGTNTGFAGGMNVGIQAALDGGADAVFILNDDVVVEAGWLQPLCDELARPRVGAAQPKLMYPDGVTINSLGVRLGRDGAGVDVGIGTADDAVLEPFDIDLFTGGAVLLSRDFLHDVGMFDERFFLYYEDVDLGLRGAAAGWTYRCAPASRVRHVGGATVAGQPARAVFLRERNRLWILIRYRPMGDVVRGVWLSIRRLRHQPRVVHAKALGSGLAALPRLLIKRLSSH